MPAGTSCWSRSTTSRSATPCRAPCSASWRHCGTGSTPRTAAAIVITGAGEKGLLRRRRYRRRSFGQRRDGAGRSTASLLKTSTFSKPIIAAVNGDCAGGGVELLIATDIRAAAPHARFGLPEVRYAIYPFGGAAVKLASQIGHVHAMDLLLTGRLVDAAHALRIGLINDIVPAGDLLAWAIGRAEMIAANSPAAVQAVKSQISAMSADHAAAHEALDQELGDRVRASPDFAEGIAAFLEKRPARYE